MKDIAVAVIDLIFAIKDHNMAETQRLVAYLNENYDPENEEGYILSDNLILDGFFGTDNDCLDYTILNLNNMNYFDTIKLNIISKKLIASNDKNKINEFVENQLNKKTYDVDDNDFLRVMTRLASFSGNYELLSRIRLELTQGE